MTEEEIMQEIRENNTVEEETEDKEDGVNQNQTVAKPKQLEIQQAIETFVPFPSPQKVEKFEGVKKVEKLELDYSMRQTTMRTFSKSSRILFIFNSLIWSIRILLFILLVSIL